MKRARYFSTFGLLGVTGGFIYLVILVAIGDTRLSDGKLSDDEMGLIEIALPFISMISLGVTAFIAFLNAFKYSRTAWCVGLFLFFPLSTFYYWKFKNEESLNRVAEGINSPGSHTT